jgi:hypothetical protein
MNLIDRLEAAWKKHDEELAENVLHAPEEAMRSLGRGVADPAS